MKQLSTHACQVLTERHSTVLSQSLELKPVFLGSDADSSTYWLRGLGQVT